MPRNGYTAIKDDQFNYRAVVPWLRHLCFYVVIKTLSSYFFKLPLICICIKEGYAISSYSSIMSLCVTVLTKFISAHRYRMFIEVFLRENYGWNQNSTFLRSSRKGNYVLIQKKLTHGIFYTDKIFQRKYETKNYLHQEFLAEGFKQIYLFWNLI
jgi:hypothetical protein